MLICSIIGAAIHAVDLDIAAAEDLMTAGAVTLFKDVHSKTNALFADGSQSSIHNCESDEGAWMMIYGSSC